MDSVRRNADTRAGVMQLGYLGFGVSDLAAWRGFAADVLGVQENGGCEDGSFYLRLDSHHHRFEIQPTGEDDVTFVGWEVKDDAALNELAAQLRAFGLDVAEGSRALVARRKVMRLITFNDPDGLAMEAYYGALVENRPFISPRGIRAFKADGLGLGHLVVAVDDAETYTRFALEVLGARVTDHLFSPRGSLTFMHVNARHHSLAVLPRQCLPPGFPAKRALHFMLEVESLDDVGIALGVCKARGVPVGDIGRHSNDHMVSFYAKTPSGFEVEYGWGAVTIDDEDTWEVRQYDNASVWGHARPQVS